MLKKRVLWCAVANATPLHAQMLHNALCISAACHNTARTQRRKDTATTIPYALGDWPGKQLGWVNQLLAIAAA